jgi:hypothetical protein
MEGMNLDAGLQPMFGQLDVCVTRNLGIPKILGMFVCRTGDRLTMRRIGICIQQP